MIRHGIRTSNASTEWVAVLLKQPVTFYMVYSSIITDVSSYPYLEIVLC